MITDTLNIEMEAIGTGRIPKVFGEPRIKAATTANKTYGYTRFVIYREAIEYLELDENDRVLIYKGIGEDCWYLSILLPSETIPSQVLRMNGTCLNFTSRQHYLKKFKDGQYKVGKAFFEERSQRQWYPLELIPGK